MNQIKPAVSAPMPQAPFAYATVIGPRPLSRMQVPLLSTLSEAQRNLVAFIDEPYNVGLLLRTQERLEQIRGILAMIELAGAELLVQEMILQTRELSATLVPVSARQLPVMLGALQLLERYLIALDLEHAPMHEVLLPTINRLRGLAGRRELVESFFFAARLQQPRRPNAGVGLAPEETSLLARRLRQGYQVGLLDLMRESDMPKALQLMGMTLARLDQLFAQGVRSQLCWVAAAAIEALLQGKLELRKARRQLFSRIDRELKQLLENPDYAAPEDLYSELLYLVALADSQGPRVREVRRAFALATLPFTDHLLEKQALSLASPNAEALAPLANELSAGLVRVQELLDQLARGASSNEGLAAIQELLSHLGDTLGMAGLSTAARALNTQLEVIKRWGDAESAEPLALQTLAEALLYVETEVASLTPVLGDSADGNDANSFARIQLAVARMVLVDEAQHGFAAARRAIHAYLESEGNSLHLNSIADNLHAVRGGLWFLDQQRAALLTGACADYIQKQMLDMAPMPSTAVLEALADVLSRLEVYLEGGGSMLRSNTAMTNDPKMLEEAYTSLRSVGVQVAA